MGVYNPNMEKPKNCYLCDFTNGYECWSNGEPWFDVKEAYAKRILSPNCPLIEIDDKEMNGLINLYKICKGTSEVKSIQLKDIKPIVF